MQTQERIVVRVVFVKHVN